MRLAVVSPFVDRRDGTERALCELLERLARDNHCEIHLYSQRVEDLQLKKFSAQSAEQGSILWHKVPSVPGPHLFQFLFWLFWNAFSRLHDRAIHSLHFDLVLSPGINCFDADVVFVHALFHRLRELAQAEAAPLVVSGLFRRLHRRTYYLFLTRLERRIYSDPKVSLAAVSSRTAALLARHFRRNDVCVVPNGVDPAQFSPSRCLGLRAKARALDKFRERICAPSDWQRLA